MGNSFYDFFKVIPEDYSVGIYGLTGICNYLNKVKYILKEGISTDSDIYISLKMYGTNELLSDNDIIDIRKKIYSMDTNGLLLNIVVAFPQELTDSLGNNYYFGKYTSDMKDKSIFPLYKLIDEQMVIPSEFIVGYIYKIGSTPVIDKNFCFEYNQKFIVFLKEDKRRKFIKKFCFILKEKNIIEPVSEKIFTIKILRRLGYYLPDDYSEQLFNYYSSTKKMK